MIERSRINLAVYTLGGIFASAVSIILSEIILYIYHPRFAVDYLWLIGEQAIIAAVFASLYLGSFPMRFTRHRKYAKLMIKHIAFVNSMISGFFGNAFMLNNLPPECNAIPVLSSFGLLLV